jgi:hypothetical protein
MITTAREAAWKEREMLTDVNGAEEAVNSIPSGSANIP